LIRAVAIPGDRLNLKENKKPRITLSRRVFKKEAGMIMAVKIFRYL
jgi:hypothetical protein